MAGVNEEVVGEILAKDEREAYTLDVDATVIERKMRRILPLTLQIMIFFIL